MAQNFIKDPDAVLDYAIDWSSWLDTDTIDESTWTLPTGITEDSSSNTNTVTTIWLSSGTVGANYGGINHIVTAAGREDDRTITIQVREK